MGRNHEDRHGGDPLERLLRSLPEQRDSRMEEDVLERLRRDSRLSGTAAGRPATGMRRRWISGLTAAAALLAAAILAPFYWTDREQAGTAVRHDTETASPAMTDEAESQPEARNFAVPASEQPGAGRHAVYADELAGKRLLTVSLAEPQITGIPISVVLTRAQLRAEGLGTGAADLELYEAFAGNRAGETSGFSPYRPLSGGAPYYMYTRADGSQFLVPDRANHAMSFAEAAEQMKTAPDRLFSSPLPAGLSFSVRQEGATAEILFEPALPLGDLGAERAGWLVDSLALTAESFGVKLKMTNVEPLDWNGFDFRDVLPAAAGANPVPALPDGD